MRRLISFLAIVAAKLSPFHHVKKGVPPTIIFHGQADPTVKYLSAEVFADAMKKAGNRCELHGDEGQPHGFFNYGRSNNKYFDETGQAMNEFLVSIGYLEAK